MAMEKLTRRFFLRSAAAAPIAAKVATDEAMMRRAAISQLPRQSGYDGTRSAGMTLWGGSAIQEEKPVWASWSKSKRFQALCEFFGGIPRKKLEEIKKSADDVRHLDIDIQAKKSWSMSAKVHEQKKRNYERLLAEYKGQFDPVAYDSDEIHNRFGIWI